MRENITAPGQFRNGVVLFSERRKGTYRPVAAWKEALRFPPARILGPLYLFLIFGAAIRKALL
jgi:hypothetical protein